MRIYVKALLLIFLLFLAVTFGTQNSEPVVLRYYFGLTSIPLPLYLVIYAAIILGIIAGMAMSLYYRVTLKRGLKKLEKANASLREELDKTRSESKEAVEGESEITPDEPEVPQKHG